MKMLMELQLVKPRGSANTGASASPAVDVCSHGWMITAVTCCD